jgi:hypothetical protein
VIAFAIDFVGASRGQPTYSWKFSKSTATRRVWLTVS